MVQISFIKWLEVCGVWWEAKEHNIVVSGNPDKFQAVVRVVAIQKKEHWCSFC